MKHEIDLNSSAPVLTKKILVETVRSAGLFFDPKSHDDVPKHVQAIIDTGLYFRIIDRNDADTLRRELTNTARKSRSYWAKQCAVTRRHAFGTETLDVSRICKGEV